MPKRNPKEFSKRMAAIAKAVERNTLKTVKRAAIAADQTAVLKTPVDTGRARANWIVSFGAPSDQIVASPGKRQAANQATEKGRQKIGQYKLGQGGIFISNSVSYITLLDAGSSKQARAGMSTAAIKAAQAQLGSVRLLGGA